MTSSSDNLNASFLKNSRRTFSEQIAGFLIFILLTLPLQIFSVQLSHFASSPFWLSRFSLNSFSFAVTSSILSLLCAAGAYLLWRAYSFKHLKLEMSLYFLAISFHTLWYTFFFYLEQPLLALITLLLLFCTLLVLSLVFWKKEKAGGILATPYLFWIFYTICQNMLFCIN